MTILVGNASKSLIATALPKLKVSLKRKHTCYCPDVHDRAKLAQLDTRELKFKLQRCVQGRNDALVGPGDKHADEKHEENLANFLVALCLLLRVLIRGRHSKLAVTIALINTHISGAANNTEWL